MSSLRALTLNTARMPTSILALLNTPNLHLQYDLLLIQEPPSTSLITNPHWNALLPSISDYSTTSTRPRALLDVNRRIASPSYNQVSIPNTRDVVAADLVVDDTAI